MGEVIVVLFHPDDRAIVRQLWIQGENAKQIAKLLGLRESVVRMTLKRIFPRGGRLM